MGWQDAPVVGQPSVPAAPAAQAPQGQQAAWMSAPVVTPEKPKDIKGLAMAKAQKYGIDPNMFVMQVGAESSFNPDAVGPKTKSGERARGLGQLMPATAAELGVTDPHDPEQNLEASAKYMSQLLKRYGNNYDTALAAYNWGMGNVDKLGMDKMPAETRDYIKKIRGGMADPDVPMVGVVGDTYRAPPAAAAPAPNVSVPENENLRALKRLGMGVEKGLVQDLPQAAAQLAGTVIPDSIERALGPNGGTINEYVEEKQKAYDTARKALGGEGIDISRLVGNLANPANYVGGAVAKIPAWFAKMSPKAQAIFRSSVMGGVAAGGQPVDTTQNPDVLLTKAQQVGTGALLGPVAEGAGKLIAKGAGQVAGAVRNELKPGATQIQALASRYGMPVSAGDLNRQSKILTGVEGQLENNRLPGLGMGGFRQEQQAKASEIATGLVGDEFKKLQSMTFQNIGAIRQAAAFGGTRQKEAQKILQMVDEAGVDERAIMQASGNMTWLRKKLSSDQLYGDVSRLAGNSEVPPSNTLKAIDNALVRANSAVDKDPASINLLMRWKQSLEAPVAPAQGGAAPALEPNTYGRMQAFKSDVYSKLEQSTQNGTTDSSKLFMKDIVKSIQDDMDNFADSTPGLKEANARANGFYQRQVVPYQKQTLAKALTNDDPDQIYGAFIRAQAEGKGDYAAKRLWSAMDEKGRQAVRYGIVKNALATSTDNGQFSATKFKNAIEGTEYGNYFRGADRAKVDGVLNLFQHLDRTTPEHLVRYNAVMGATTAQALGIGAVAGAGGVPMLAAGAGGAAFLKWLMTSDAGKRVLFSSNVLAKGGSKEQIGKFLDRTAEEFGKATSTAAGAEVGQQGRVLP